MSAIRKIQLLRRSFNQSKVNRYEHMLNYKDSKTFPQLIATKRKRTEDEQQQSVKKQKVYRPTVEKPNLSPEKHLFELGIENKQDYRNWLKLYHPDKGGSVNECAKVLAHAKIVFNKKVS